MTIKRILLCCLLCLASVHGLFSTPHICCEKSFTDPLYPLIPAREEGMLKVSETHTIFYALYGNPHGIPIVFLHGGPGGGCNDTMAQFFDPSRWNVIMLDQRGAMRSQPFGCMEDNTPQDLVRDIERLRTHLGITRWAVTGGSWGSTLALLYGQEYPDSCLAFLLRGVWLAREQDYNHVLYGMAKLFPDAYQAVLNHIPEEERSDLLDAYYRRVFDPDPDVQLAAARAIMRFDAICSTIESKPALVDAMMQDDQIVISVARAFFHYAKHQFFLEPNQILSHMEKIAHLPAIIVQGRYDVVCFPEIAYAVFRHWPNCGLWMIPNGGHSDDELPMAAAMIAAAKTLADNLPID